MIDRFEDIDQVHVHFCSALSLARDLHVPKQAKRRKMNQSGITKVAAC